MEKKLCLSRTKLDMLTGFYIVAPFLILYFSFFGNKVWTILNSLYFISEMHILSSFDYYYWLYLVW